MYRYTYVYLHDVWCICVYRYTYVCIHDVFDTHVQVMVSPSPPSFPVCHAGVNSWMWMRRLIRLNASIFFECGTGDLYFINGYSTHMMIWCLFRVATPPLCHPSLLWRGGAWVSKIIIILGAQIYFRGAYIYMYKHMYKYIHIYIYIYTCLHRQTSLWECCYIGNISLNCSVTFITISYIFNIRSGLHSTPACKKYPIWKNPYIGNISRFPCRMCLPFHAYLCLYLHLHACELNAQRRGVFQQIMML